MHRPVMGPADQGQVGQVGGTPVQPVDQVVAFAPGQGAGTVGDHTAAVAHGQGGALGGADDPGGSAQVQGLAGRPTQQRGQAGQGGLQPRRQPRVAAARVVGGVGVVVAGVVAAGALVRGLVVTGAAGLVVGMGAVVSRVLVAGWRLTMTRVMAASQASR
jgi:hypothetical protein